MIYDQHWIPTLECQGLHYTVSPVCNKSEELPLSSSINYVAELIPKSSLILIPMIYNVLAIFILAFLTL